MELATMRSDPVWTDRYGTVRDRFERTANAGLLDVFHVGSTAIEDIAGKPALDVIVVYEDRAALKTAAESLAALDGHDLAYDEEGHAVVANWGEDDAEFLKLHLPGDERVRNQLAFRDYVRDHPEARAEYEAVKREAAVEHPRGGQEYTAAKRAVVSDILDRARETGYFEGLPETV